MIVELMDDHQYSQDNNNLISKVKSLRNYIYKFGYNEIYRDDINTIFIRE